MATIKDVAQSAQVSATTVSRVLNRDDNMSVTPEVRMRIFQAAHALGYVSPRQRRAAAEKTKLIIGVADWRIIRPDRPNIRLSSLSCLVQMMTDQYDVSFIRLVFGQPQPVDGVIAFGAFTAPEMDFLRSLAFRELGLRVPKDVAVIIYQDIQTLESKWPTGTCIEMFPDYIWENALEILFGRISQKRTQAVTVVVPTHIRIGDTA